MRLRDEHKEHAIRDKAIQMIVQHGFDGLSMQKLAKAAKVSPATIYLYYKNREDLLNQVYMYVDRRFTEITLQNFDPEMSFEAGLWLQWKNRLEHNMNYPHHIVFMEQFRSSPLINHKDIVRNSFTEAMEKFYDNSIKKKELIDVPVQIFWAIAYGPLYTLIRFHFGKKPFLGSKFKLSEAIMKQAFDLVIKALKRK